MKTKAIRGGMVTIYPPPRSTHFKLSGVAWYAKSLVTSLLDYCKMIVFADRIRTNDEYRDEGVIVFRCWSKGILYPFQIFSILSRNVVNIVHIQHEIFLYGGLGSALAFPLMLILIRLLHKPLIVTFHGVIPLSKIDGQFLRENRIGGIPILMKIGMIPLVRIIVFLSTSVVVHEEMFKKVLEIEYNCPVDKVCVIHLGIGEKGNPICNLDAKEELGLSGKNVILFFGYITGYKNIELLIESTNFLKTPNWVMIIAGGSHPRLGNDPVYRKYLSNLQERALEISKDKILFKGFIAEQDIPLYFSAADLVVFPYTAAMSSSGPLCVAISYKRPFLVSSSMKHMIEVNESIFDAKPQALAIKIDAFFQSQDVKSKILRYIERLHDERSWICTAERTFDLYERMI